MKSLNFFLLVFFAFIILGNAQFKDAFKQKFGTILGPVLWEITKFAIPSVTLMDALSKPPVYRLDKADCECRFNTTSRIIGGQFAPNYIPWQVSLANLGMHKCGGIIVNHHYILTAAHCVEEKFFMTARFGILRLDEIKFDLDIYTIGQVFRPRNITVVKLEKADLALVRLNEPIHFVKGKVSPACLNIEVEKKYDSLMVSGWGNTTPKTQNKITGHVKNGPSSLVLKQAYLKELPKTYCGDKMICTNSTNGQSSCYGDSGGPLHHTVNGITTVEGVAAFTVWENSTDPSILTACTGLSGFVRLSAYKSWIKTVIGDQYCSA